MIKNFKDWKLSENKEYTWLNITTVSYFIDNSSISAATNNSRIGHNCSKFLNESPENIISIAIDETIIWTNYLLFREFAEENNVSCTETTIDVIDAHKYNEIRATGYDSTKIKFCIVSGSPYGNYLFFILGTDFVKLMIKYKHLDNLLASGHRDVLSEFLKDPQFHDYRGAVHGSNFNI